MREEVYPHDATIVPAQLAWCPTSASHLLAAHAQRRRALVECWPLAKGRTHCARPGPGRVHLLRRTDRACAHALRLATGSPDRGHRNGANLASTQSQATAAAYALLHPKPTDTSKPTTAPKPTNTPKPPTATVPQKSNSTPTIPLVTGATLGGLTAPSRRSTVMPPMISGISTGSRSAPTSTLAPMASNTCSRCSSTSLTLPPGRRSRLSPSVLHFSRPTPPTSAIRRIAEAILNRSTRALCSQSPSRPHHL